MSDLGTRILTALRSITTDPALVAKVEASTESDAAQGALLDTLGTTTSDLADQVAELHTEIAALPGGTDTTALQAKVDALQTTIDSLDAAFPEVADPAAPAA